MVLLTRIYTRAGDQGKTSLGDGSRLSKHAVRIEAIGAIDEANSSIGLARLYIEKTEDERLERIQNDLFDVGADLCMPHDPDAKSVLRIHSNHVLRLEEEIDHLNKYLNPLTSFVLPGGSAASAFLHLSRTIVRRAERLLCSLAENENLNSQILIYLNRLSDYLFVLARYANDQGRTDVLWKPGANIETTQND